jgi:transposase
VVLIVDDAPRHRGQPIDEALVANPQLELKRLPSYSPQLDVIERFRKLLRRRATHNRLFDTIADLRRSIRVTASPTSRPSAREFSPSSLTATPRPPTRHL